MNGKKVAAVFQLSGETVIEVVRTKEGEVPVVKEMTFNDWLNIKKTKGYVYTAFQKGFQQYSK